MDTKTLEEIKLLHKNKVSHDDIADIIGVSLATVIKACGRKLREKDVLQVPIEEMYTRGYYDCSPAEQKPDPESEKYGFHLGGYSKCQTRYAQRPFATSDRAQIRRMLSPKKSRTKPTKSDQIPV